jgi:hypothetical protein
MLRSGKGFFMKYIVFTLVLVMLFAVPAMAGNGNVSKGTLEKMGLSAMKTMTDVEGASIRGSGFALAFGFSNATGGFPSGYFRTSPPNPVAAGVNLSVGSGVFAGGGSIAFTK